MSKLRHNQFYSHTSHCNLGDVDHNYRCSNRRPVVVKPATIKLRRHIALFAVLCGSMLIPNMALAQYYQPIPAAPSASHQPGGVGVDIGLRPGGFYPAIGAGIGQVGTGIGAGLGVNGLGYGIQSGAGPIGLSTNGGLGRQGLGTRASAGIANTGASVEGGLSQGGLGVGASAKLLGFGTGASLGVGKNGPGLGASLAFGKLGTLVIGSHKNSYPGAGEVAAQISPYANASYYQPQYYGNAPYYDANSNAGPVANYGYVNYAPNSQASAIQAQSYNNCSARPLDRHINILIREFLRGVEKLLRSRYAVPSEAGLQKGPAEENPWPSLL